MSPQVQRAKLTASIDENTPLEFGSKIDGVLMVLLECLRQQRFPRALALKAKLDDGQVLDEYDISFLERAFGKRPATTVLQSER